ncbi:pentatricopeptide repeat-containing protein At5g50990 isoform X1 [Cucurbita maxima]|uniref:Pentatricopeptide repeat-containing protein At5g50990 isoform X1 n=1 Tax=Cucurbita maxima TaxID=3661 RepID=A0A6J1JLQ2_CUCMA|nr:pentatricopeptide repeat-containing protein At5g50990 isoform X1 [Cucurbita maxima]
MKAKELSFRSLYWRRTGKLKMFQKQRYLDRQRITSALLATSAYALPGPLRIPRVPLSSLPFTSSPIHVHYTSCASLPNPLALLNFMSIRCICFLPPSPPSSIPWNSNELEHANSTSKFTVEAGNGYQTLYRVLEACRLSPSNSKTASETHARMIKFGYGNYPTLVTSLVSAYQRADCLNRVHQLLNLLCSKHLDLVAMNLFIDNFMKIGECKLAKRVFDKMPYRDVVTWNSIIGGCVKNARYEEAFKFFRQMLVSNIQPDGFTFASVLNACAQLGAPSNTQWVHALMTQKKIDLNSILSCALIDAYSKCGSIQIAKEIFSSVPRSNISVWNAMIKGLAIHGLSMDALSVFWMMERENVLPDAVTFLGILTACNHGGLIEQGRRFFDWMKNRYSIQPQLEHYGVMVDLYSRAGFLEEAYSIIVAMPIEADVVTWRALLSGCRIYRNQELAEVAIANMSHRGSGDYVLLSNIYCSLNRWEHAERVRERMKSNGVRKSCGKSWIELGGSIQSFRSGDRSHPESDAVYKVVWRLMKRSRSEGYMPVTDLVLMDISEEEKEENLSYHSEKLALAYAILKTSPGAKISISKNLRMCDDCHRWIKIVSTLLCRVVVVRDRIRFHQFEGGMCSCGDRW